MRLPSVIICAALSLFSLCTSAEQTPDEGKVFVIGVENIHYLPHYNFDGIHYTGFARDFFDGFAEAAGYQFAYKAMPTGRLYSNLIKGRVDFKYPDNASWAPDERVGKSYSYSKEVAPFTDGVMVLPANKGKSEIKRLGSIKGFQAWGYLDDIKAGNIELVEKRGFIQLLRSTLEGQVDGSFMNVDVAKYQIDNVLQRPDSIVFDDGLPHSSDSYTLSTLNHPEVIEQLNRYIAENGEVIRQLKIKHGLAE